MPDFSVQQLNQYRATTFRSLPGNRITSPADAIQFVNQRGFIFFWPVKGIVLPSLWVAFAGDRPVPDEHDDPVIKPGWKDDSLDKGYWYYSKYWKTSYFYLIAGNTEFLCALTQLR